MNNELANLIAMAVATAVEAYEGKKGQSPKTSAKVKGPRSTAPSKMTAPKTSVRTGNTNDPKHVEVPVTAAMLKGRMVLPSRMFGSKDTVQIDGTDFGRDESNNGRSLKFYPSVFGAVKEGQTLVFDFVKQTTSRRVYDLAIEGKGQASKAKAAPSPAPTPKASPKAKAKAVPTEDEDEVESKFSAETLANAKRIRSCKSKKALIELCGEIAIDNEANGRINPNISASKTFREKLGQDSREFLLTPESRAFASTAKKLGFTMGQAVAALNTEFNSYE